VNISLITRSLRAVQLSAGVLGRAGESGQKKRMEAAAKGEITWETPRDLLTWHDDQQKLLRERSKEARERANPNLERAEKVVQTKEELLDLDRL
jgi:small subunit ribosomal protein S2